MSGLEHEELERRMQGMTKEEKVLAARALPDEVLWNELYQRFSNRSAMLEIIMKTTNRPGERFLLENMKIGSATVESHRT